MNICAEEPAVATTITPPLSRNTSAGRPVAPDTAPLPLSFLPPFGRVTISDSPCPGGFAPRGNAPRYCCNARRSEDSPNRISFDRHSSLTDLTHRSACEFKFGLLAGRRIVSTLPDSISSRNDAQNFVSRSCNRYWQFLRNPHSSMVTLRACCSIHSRSGYGVIPARLTLRLSKWIKQST